MELSPSPYDIADLPQLPFTPGLAWWVLGCSLPLLLSVGVELIRRNRPALKPGSRSDALTRAIAQLSAARNTAVSGGRAVEPSDLDCREALTASQRIVRLALTVSEARHNQLLATEMTRADLESWKLVAPSALGAVIDTVISSDQRIYCGTALSCESYLSAVAEMIDALKRYQRYLLSSKEP